MCMYNVDNTCVVILEDRSDEYNFPISFISQDILKITLKNEFKDILLNFETKKKYEYE